MTKRAVDISRNAGIKSINIDLIYGLPFQNLQKFQNTLEQIKVINPDRLAIFNYAHVPWLKKTMRKIDETTLPTPSEKLQILRYTIDFLTSNGYKMIGMDHFAKPNDELFLAIEKGELNRNFQGYTTKKSVDLIGVGLTSISEGEIFYAQNFKDMNLYEEAIDRGELPIERGIELTQNDYICKYTIMELMANFKIDIERFNSKFDIDFFNYFNLEPLDEFINDGLVTLTKKSIEVSETGTLLIRNIAMVFDKYLQNIDDSKRVFSKTV